MAKRKKYPKLPNGYGSIRYLGKGRRNPFAVHPPVTEFDEEGRAVRPVALCYVDDWIKGFAVLTAYKAGNFVPGMEKDFTIGDRGTLSDLTTRILADYNRIREIEPEEKAPTFAEIYKKFYEWKYNSGKQYSQASMLSTQAAFKNCSTLHDRVFKDLRYNDLQAVINDCPLKHASLELIVSLFKQMYAYADIQEYVDRDYSAHVKINKPDDDESGIPFTDDDLAILWKHKSDPTIEFILIMCYSGYRISAYASMEVNLKEGYFKGGVKTRAGKNRVVPIHSAIFPLVNKRMARDGKLLVNSSEFRKDMYDILRICKIQKHTPHDCRHTFSYLCEKYGVNENDRKRMLGHSFGSDITNQVYGHRTLEDLKKEIEKICV
ncbi:MAG: integrase [Coprococcus sp.]|nr:integrase [Coprococcus sp.]